MKTEREPRRTEARARRMSAGRAQKTGKQGASPVDNEDKPNRDGGLTDVSNRNGNHLPHSRDRGKH